MDLFDYMQEDAKRAQAPLAVRMRPRVLEEVVGQEHILGKGKLLYRAIQADRMGSIIFYGPPGTGKTTIARVIANTTRADFKQINATVAGKKEMEEVVNQAKQWLGMYGKKTILFVDEIHRFNRAQQDYLLPFVEDGTLTLIGATTENPYFEVNAALLSRSSVFELKTLKKEDIALLLRRAIDDQERGLGKMALEVELEAISFWQGNVMGMPGWHSRPLRWRHSQHQCQKMGELSFHFLRLRNVFKREQCIMINKETITTIRFLRLLRVCEALILMPQYII